jgi:hypothetical protein
MPAPTFPSNVLTPKQQEYYEAVKKHGSMRAAGKALGVDHSTISRAYNIAKRKMELDPAIAESMGAVGTGLIPALAWAKTKNPDGTSYSVLLKPPPEEVENIAEQIKATLEGMTPAALIPAPVHCDSDLLTLYPITDAHIGMMAWGKETGEDYDTQIAHDRLVSWMGRAVSAAPTSKTAIVLDVGDLNHSDDQKNMTPGSGHILDADTRHFKTLEVTIAAMATAVEMAATKHERVIVRILPGNHNPTSYMAVLFALAERYRDNPRIEVQKVPGEFFVHQFGKCLIAAHHGDKAKAERLVMFVADSYAEAWGKTTHRFLFTGHRHHSRIEDIGGVLVEQLRAMTAKDAYAVSHAYSARAQLQAITYHRDLGEIERAKIGMITC